MKVKIYARMEIRDSKGKLISKGRKKLLHSYVRGFVDALGALMGNGAQVLDVTNILRTWANQGLAYSSAGDTTYGIVVGTGTDAVTIDDYKIKTLILHGSTTGKLSYGATSVGTCSSVGTSRIYTIARTFTNLSGDDITYREVGLYLKIITAQYLCIEHSLLEGTIANGTSGTLTYTISVSV